MGLPSGLKWAPMNVDALQKRGFALSPYQYNCSFVSWGNVVPHNPNNEGKFDYDWGGKNEKEPWYENQPYGLTPGSELETDIDITHDIAHKICGGKWRMPTSAEFEELIDNCYYVQADGTTVIADDKTDKRVTVNGVLGIYLKSKINGKLLFIACSGNGNGTSWENRGLNGYYWTASFFSDSAAGSFFFTGGSMNPQGKNNRFNGFAVRPVYDEKLEPVGEKVTISVSCDPSQGSVSGGGRKVIGTSITVVATPAEGYKFDGWYENDTLVSSNASYTFNASVARNLVAVFAESHEVVIQASVNVDPSLASVTGTGSYEVGDTVTLQSTKASSAQLIFAGWYEGSTRVSSNNPYTFTAETNRTLVAHWNTDE